MSSQPIMHKPYSFQDISIMKKILECKKNYDIAEIEIRGIKERVNNMKDTKDTAAPFFLQLREAEQNMERWNIISLMRQVAAEDFREVFANSRRNNERDSQEDTKPTSLPPPCSPPMNPMERSLDLGSFIEPSSVVSSNNENSDIELKVIK